MTCEVNKYCYLCVCVVALCAVKAATQHKVTAHPQLCHCSLPCIVLCAVWFSLASSSSSSSVRAELKTMVPESSVLESLANKGMIYEKLPQIPIIVHTYSVSFHLPTIPSPATPPCPLSTLPSLYFTRPYLSASHHHTTTILIPPPHHSPPHLTNHLHYPILSSSL